MSADWQSTMKAGINAVRPAVPTDGRAYQTVIIDLFLGPETRLSQCFT